MDKLLNLLAWIALEVAGSVATLSGKAIAIIASVLGLVICLCVLMSNGKQNETFIHQPRPAFKSKEECYQVVDERRRKCEAKGRHPILCVDDEYCDERGCC
ncbi:MAG: hypothetical protein FWF63_00415 [Fibromonadales bacterium]|nr:hypothetical protein [Fibromonadales bacterium]